DHLRIISGIAICNRRREAAAWARGVQAGSARVTGCVFEGLRHARPERAEIRAFRRRQGDDRRATERGIELIKEMLAIWGRLHCTEKPAACHRCAVAARADPMGMDPPW